MVRLVQVNLERGGYEVVCAFSEREALEKIANEDPNFIIIDVTEPDLDGYALTRQIKHNPATESLRVMLIIPSNAESEIAKAKSSGADRYFILPMNPIHLPR